MSEDSHRHLQKVANISCKLFDIWDTILSHLPLVSPITSWPPSSSFLSETPQTLAPSILRKFGPVSASNIVNLVQKLSKNSPGFNWLNQWFQINDCSCRIISPCIWLQNYFSNPSVQDFYNPSRYDAEWKTVLQNHLVSDSSSRLIGGIIPSWNV